MGIGSHGRAVCHRRLSICRMAILPGPWICRFYSDKALRYDRKRNRESLRQNDLPHYHLAKSSAGHRRRRELRYTAILRDLKPIGIIGRYCRRRSCLGIHRRVCLRYWARSCVLHFCSKLALSRDLRSRVARTPCRDNCGVRRDNIRELPRRNCPREDPHSYERGCQLSQHTCWGEHRYLAGSSIFVV